MPHIKPDGFSHTVHGLLLLKTWHKKNFYHVTWREIVNALKENFQGGFDKFCRAFALGEVFLVVVNSHELKVFPVGSFKEDCGDVSED